MTSSRKQYKITRVAEEFDLPDIEDELVAHRTRERDSLSLRKLATLFNRRLLQSAMENAGMDPLQGEVENTYRLLTDDEVSSGVRTETEKKLERNGIDVERLQTSFVTYQAVRTYLKEACDIEYERQTDDSDRIEKARESVERLRNRTVLVVEERLSQLRQSEDISLGEFRVLLDVQVFCEDCRRQYEFRKLLKNAGCDCADENSTSG